MKELTLKVSVNGDTVDVKNNGFFSNKLADKDNIAIHIEVPNDPNIILLTKDGQKKLIQMKPPYEVTDEFSTVMYRKKVGVTDDKGTREPHVHYPTNCFEILEIQKFGWFTIWEISIVSQYGSFYLRKQKVYNERCYFKQGKTFCPFFEKESQNHWPSLLEVLYTLIKPDKLPSIAKYKSPKEIKPETIAEDEGIVLWYSQAMQTGCAMTSKGTARINFRNIETTFPYKMLLPRQKIRYKKIETPKTSKRDTGFNCQLFSVTLQS